MQVELYTRRGSAASDEARAILERVRGRIPFELVAVDVEQDERLKQRFERHAPVVYVAGRRAFRGRVDEAALVRRLEQARDTGLDAAPVGHGAKRALAALTVLGLAGFAAIVGHRKLVREPALELRSLDVTAEGFAAPPFALVDQKNVTHALSDYKGKVLFVNLWASWCAPCREEVPDMARLAMELGDHRDFEMLAVSVDDGWPPVQAFFQKTFGSVPPPFSILLDPGAKVSNAYGTSVFPESYVVDRQGKVIAKFVGAREWNTPAAKQYLEQLIEK
jgi:cytochrome c biogenesis protein CcmG, thiol:disulfide interchange protein DsbE